MCWMTFGAWMVSRKQKLGDNGRRVLAYFEEKQL